MEYFFYRRLKLLGKELESKGQIAFDDSTLQKIFKDMTLPDIVEFRRKLNSKKLVNYKSDCGRALCLNSQARKIIDNDSHGFNYFFIKPMIHSIGRIISALGVIFSILKFFKAD